ncbi:hypothetical protein C8Q78DRAFT_987245 [Trametes maxima]|nr:hypothetical protein C8Q78DRAFT_987245 [Trametes maxima]
MSSRSTRRYATASTGGRPAEANIYASLKAIREQQAAEEAKAPATKSATSRRGRGGACGGRSSDFRRGWQNSRMEKSWNEKLKEELKGDRSQMEVRGWRNPDTSTICEINVPVICHHTSEYLSGDIVVLLKALYTAEHRRYNMCSHCQLVNFYILTCANSSQKVPQGGLTTAMVTPSAEAGFGNGDDDLVSPNVEADDSSLVRKCAIAHLAETESFQTPSSARTSGVFTVQAGSDSPPSLPKKLPAREGPIVDQCHKI